MRGWTWGHGGVPAAKKSPNIATRHILECLGLFSTRPLEAKFSATLEAKMRTQA